MDILQYMKAAHDELKGAVETLQNEGSVRVRRDVVDQFGVALEVHLTLEGQYLYPEVAGMFPEADAVVSAGMANAVVLRKKFKVLKGLMIKPAAMQNGTDKKLAEMANALESHITLQEQHLMPRLRGAMRTEDREDLGALFVDVRDELKAAVAVPEQRNEPGRKASKKRA